jgi:hypothetical protein
LYQGTSLLLPQKELPGWTSRKINVGLHRLRENSHGRDVLKGRGFSRAATDSKSMWALVSA